MIRIYLTKGGVEGYSEGCSCCSSIGTADLNDIKQLIKRLDAQKQQLSMLAELIDEYGSLTVTNWYNTFETVRRLQADKEAGEKYSKDKTIQGTWYKESWESLPKIIRQLEVATKELNKTPALFRKYMKESA